MTRLYNEEEETVSHIIYACVALHIAQEVSSIKKPRERTNLFNCRDGLALLRTQLQQGIQYA